MGYIEVMEAHIEDLPYLPSYPKWRDGEMVRILVIGQSPLAQRIAAFQRELGAQVRNPGQYSLDVTSSSGLANEMMLFRPHLVINAAEKANLIDCERRPEGAIAVNAVGAAKVALICHLNDIELVHISTDMVFSGFGDGGPYSHLDDPYPVNAYGLSKMIGENAVMAFMKPGRYTIVRVGWLYGAGIDEGPVYDAASTFSNRISGDVKTSRRAWIPARQQGTPTHLGEAAYTITYNVRTMDAMDPIVHLAPPEVPVSWYTFLEDDFPLVEEVDPKRVQYGHPNVTLPQKGGLAPTVGWSTERYAVSLDRYRKELEGLDGRLRSYTSGGKGS